MSSADDENARLGKLIERLLVDPQFRTEFRSDPAQACLAAGLPELAAELGRSGKSMHTLELRESRSSLAGVVMAVAVEGMSVVEAKALMEHGMPSNVHGARKLLHGHRLPDSIQQAQRAPSKLQHELKHAAGGSPSKLQHELEHAERAQGAGGATGAAGAGAASAAGGAASAGGGAASVGGEAAGAGGAAGGGAAAGASAHGGGSSVPWPDENSAGGGAAGSGGAEPVAQSPAAAGRAGVPTGGAASGAAPAGASAPTASGAASAPPAAGAAPGAAAAAASPGAPVPAPPNPGAQPIDGGAVPVWPDQQPGAGAAVGAAGGGGAGGGLLALLDSPRLSAPPNVRTFLASGGVDPRMVSVLDSALANHTIGLGQVEALSDPVHVQAVDIVSVDGQPVGPDNFGARDLVTEIAALDPSVRPSEIGTPWPIRSQGFFSDAGVVNRLHLAFEMPGTDSPPVGAGAQAVPGLASPAGAPAPAAGQVAYPAPAAGQVALPDPAGGQVAAGNLAATPSAGVALSSLAPAPVAASMPGTGVDAALAYARAMIGKLPESAGNNLGPQLDRFEADFGFHGAAWCGIFAGHVLEAAGLRVPHTVASVASILDLARTGDPPFVKGVLPVSAARPGDLVTFGGTEHVAVVIKVDSAGVHTIAGNTSQSNVSETTYSPGSVTGVVRPDYAAGKPGSIPGVWNYAGVQPPPAGGGAAAPAAVSGAPGVAATPTPGAGISGAPGAGATPAPAASAAAAVAGAPGGGASPTPGAPAQAGAGGAAAGPPQPGTAQFRAFEQQERSFHRHTVKFLQAVPAPGSPQAGQGVGGAVQPPGSGVAASQAGGAQQVAGAPAAGAPAAPVQPGAPAAADQVAGQGAGAPPVGGGAITVNSSLLTPGQEKFAARLAELTGLNPRVVAAWELAEESGGAAQSREAASNFNWLNIGYFDSGAGKIAFDQAFRDPVSAAEQTAKFLKGEWAGASPGIRAILHAVGQAPDQQMAAIANSGWASSHYGGGSLLHGTYNELSDIQVQGTNVA